MRTSSFAIYQRPSIPHTRRVCSPVPPLSTPAALFLCTSLPSFKRPSARGQASGRTEGAGNGGREGGRKGGRLPPIRRRHRPLLLPLERTIRQQPHSSPSLCETADVYVRRIVRPLTTWANVDDVSTDWPSRAQYYGISGDQCSSG